MASGSAIIVDGQIDIIIADLEEYTRLEVVALSLNMVANLQEEPPLGTPVDTGWARANWLPSVGQPKEMDAKAEEPTPAQVAARAKVAQDGLNEVLAWKLEDGPIFATNNVPYIGALNAGHSKQSPRGFVQFALEKAVKDTDAAAARKGSRNRRAAAFRERTGKPPRKPGR
jgi:hypothetical protein